MHRLLQVAFLEETIDPCDCSSEVMSVLVVEGYRKNRAEEYLDFLVQTRGGK